MAGRSIAVLAALLLVSACAVTSNTPSDFVVEQSVVKTLIKDRARDRKLEYQFAANMQFKTVSRIIGSENAKQCQQYARNRVIKLSWTQACDAALLESNLSKHNQTASLFNRGIMHMKLDDLTSAKKDFQNVLSVDPSFGDAYLSLGTIAANAAEFRNAKTYADKALAVNITQPARVHVLIGFVAEQEFEFDKARAAYQEALRERPGAADIRRKLERLDRLWPEDQTRTDQ